MKTVSTAYAEQMKKQMRNPGRVSVAIDLTSEEARENAIYTDLRTPSVTDSYSTTTNLFQKDRPVYTFAEFYSNIFKADGSLRFADPNAQPQSLDAGLILTEDWSIAGGAQFAAEMSSPVRIKGITIGFPAMTADYTFTVTLKDSNGGTIATAAGHKTFTADDTVFEWSYGWLAWMENVSRVEFLFDNNAAASTPHIQYIMFGVETEIDEYKILSVNITRHESPIMEELPQADVEVEIININNEFTYDYPTSMVYSLDTRQPLIIKMGYTLDDSTVEWVNVGRFSISSWTVSRTKLVVTATDIFRTLDEIYYWGSFKNNTVGDAAAEICGSEGIMTDTGAGDALRFSNPLPPVPKSECLQLLCGLGMFRLVQGDTSAFIKIDGTVLGEAADFMLEDIDILDEAATIKNPQVKDIVVYYTSYEVGKDEDDIEVEGVTLPAGEPLFLTWDTPASIRAVRVNGSVVPFRVVRSGAYAISIAFQSALSDATVSVRKCPLVAAKGYVRKNLNPSGITVEWDNPLASTASMANYIATLLWMYYKYGVLTYDFPYRGNPEIECGDHIYYTTETGLHPPMIVEQNDLSFNGAFRGHISGRRSLT